MQHLRNPQFHLLGTICEALLGNAVGTAYGKEWTRHRIPFKEPMGSVGVNIHHELI